MEFGALVLVGAFLGSLGVTELTRRTVLRMRVVAEPNARSSHEHTMASAGGVGFVVPILLLVGILDVPQDLRVTVLVGGGLLAVVGFVDDWIEVSRLLRLAVQAGAAALFLALAPIDAPIWIAVFGLGLVWGINLYNFMDGIDGLAASQAVAFALGVLVLAPGNVLAPFAWLVIATGAGFLVFNWAPARIFMGDVGSGFLGLLVGAVAVHLHLVGAVPLVASLVLLSVFWFDATYTLCVRIVGGQQFWDAHRTHLYQILARRLGHGRTTTVFWAFWTLWLLPLAFAATQFPTYAWFLLATACVPVAVGSMLSGAGRPEPEATNA